MSRNAFSTLLVAACLFAGSPAEAARPPLHTLVFTTVSNVAAGSAAHVSGNRTEMGSLSVTGAIRLYTIGGNAWTGRVAVQGSVTTTVVSFKFFSRATNSGSHCDSGNGVPGPAITTTNVPLWEPGYTGKTIYYHSRMTNVMILYRASTGFAESPMMTRIGDGRSAGEHLYQVGGIGEAGVPLEFVPHGFSNGVADVFDNSLVPGYGINNFYTPLDTFFLQDKNIFNYTPPAAVSAPQVLTVNNWPSSYTGNGIPSRGGRVYLPRGYTQNTTKRYPVLYLHDGQNVFDPGGPFGSWSADAAATREISQGRMRETIIVAVNNSNNRNSEYGPPQDGYTGDYYLKFLVDNVKPSINSTYRTLTNFMDTGNMGSSLGGIISAYIGLSTNVFGLIGAVSPSYWYGPNFRSWIQTQNTKGNRIYQDCGTAEGASMWDHFWPVYSYYLQDNYAVNDDLLYVVGCGHGHNEAAWASRVDGAFRYLYHPWDEVNGLETNAALSPGTLQFLESMQAVAETGVVARITVSRTGGSSGAASVDYATSNGTATAGVDYTGANSTLNWTNGDSADKFFDALITDDPAFEGDETFSAVLSGASGASLGSPTSTTVTITDNEPPPPDLLITNPPSDIVVSNEIAAFDLQGVANTNRGMGLFWTNSLTGNSGQAPIGDSWTIGGIGLGAGTNVITVSATNVTFASVTNAADSGASAAYADGWDAADNGGAGFGAWQFFTTSPSINENGRFMATSAAVHIGVPAWGLYANTTNLSEAKRVLTTALVTGQTFRVRLDNGFINPASSIGIALQNAGGETLWQFYFIGGDDFYSISGGTTDVGWTSTGLDIEFTLTGPTNYLSRITPLGGATRTNTCNLSPAANSTITLFRAWNFKAGAGSDFDVFFNDLRIESPLAVHFSTGAAVRITRDPPLLHDGIPLSWWDRYGLGTNSSATSHNDSDEADNGEEYVADTNPTNSASVYSNRILSANGAAILSLQAGPPTTNSRLYDVWYGTNLLEGIWTPLNLDQPGASNGAALFLTVTNSAGAGQYRTGVKLP